MTDPRSGRLTNGTINYNHNTPPFNPYGSIQQQPAPYMNFGAPVPSYYQYANPYNYDPNLVYNPYFNPQATMPMPPTPNFYHNSLPSTPISSGNGGTPKKKMQYQNQHFVPQKDHNQYLQNNNYNNHNNNHHQPPPQQYPQQEPQSINQTPLESPISSTSIDQSSSEQNNHTAVSTPPSSNHNISTSSKDPIQNIENHNNTVQENGSISKDLVFHIEPVDDKVALPLFFGTTSEKLLSQKKKFRDIEEAKKEKEEQERLAQEVKEKSLEEEQSIKTPSPEPLKPTVAKWSFIAEQAVKKNSPKSISPSVTTTTSIKKEERFVPSVSNVLEPLGVVLLRSMFDKNFQKAFVNNNKLPNIVPRGLVNTGNICFMSSILQLLLYCQPFLQTLNIISTKTIQSLSNTTSQTPLIDAVIELFKNFNIKLDEGKKFAEPLVPEQFYKEISKHSRFSHLQWGQQEDAEEFFGYLLDGLHEEFIASVKNLKTNDVKILLDSITTEETRLLIKQSLKKFSNEEDFNSKNESNGNSLISDDGWLEVGSAKKKVSAKRTVEVKPSPIRQLFGGQFRSVLDIPKQRESQSITLDPFQQIQLDISDESIQTLEDAFKHISQIEEIPYKSNEGNEVIAKKQTFIDKLPEVLVVHLKRFSFVNKINDNNEGGGGYKLNSGRIEKIRKKINYQHEFSIPIECISTSTRKFNPILKYKLIGVVYHHGISSEGGHYTVDVLRNDEDKWIRIDDTIITQLEPEEVLVGGDNDEVKTAYILMYQKITS